LSSVAIVDAAKARLSSFSADGVAFSANDALSKTAPSKLSPTASKDVINLARSSCGPMSRQGVTSGGAANAPLL